MIKILAIILIVFAVIHGLIHLMGFAAYWPLVKIDQLPYKTTLLSGRWEVGPGGMRLYSLLWLLAGLGFVVAALALAFGQGFWAPLMLGSALLSLLTWIDVAFLLVLLVVFGFRVQPQPFPAYTASAIAPAAAPVAAPVAAPQTVPLPDGLPAPVERFYRLVYGDQIPVYHSAVMTGRGSVRFMGVTMPARLRFTHLSGQDYRHYIETTFYGVPLLKVNERYVAGQSRLELPFGVVENDPGVNSAANQGLWGETFAYPAYLLTDPRATWEAVDDHSAVLHVPYGDGEQVFTVAFDPQSGLVKRFETLRYRDEKLGSVRWWGDFIYKADSAASPVPEKLAAVWEDEGTPWLVVNFEDTVFNSDVTEYLQQKGP